MKRKNNKLILLLAAILALSVFLAACGGSGGDAASSTAEEAPASEAAAEDAGSSEAEEAEATGGGEGFVIGFSNFSVSNTWRVQFEEEFKYRAEQMKEEGILSDYIMTNSQNDATKQVSDIQDLITKGVDAIVVTAGNPDAIAPVCEDAVDQGIVVVSCDQLVNSDKLDATISTKYYEVGVSVGNFMKEHLGTTGKIIVLEGIAGTAGSEDEVRGFNDAIADCDFEILASVPCDWDYATAKKAMEGLITAHPEIDGIASMGGAMTQAALEVMDAAGRPIDIPMSGEANNGFLKAWKKYLPQGYIGNAYADLTSSGARGLEIAVDILQGNPPAEKNMAMDIPVITEDTLDEYLREDLSDGFWNVTILPDETIERLFKE